MKKSKQLYDKLTYKDTLSVGVMLFGLFFGAGNLIFPVHMGQLAGERAWIASAGFILTGVGLPLLGVAAIGRSKSEGLLEMAAHVGKRWSIFFSIVLYLTIGPFFAIPRTATTAFTVGVEPLVGQGNSSIWLLIFSIIFFALVLFFSLRPGKILTWVGKVITPIFLVFLAALLLFAFIHPMGAIKHVTPDPSYANSTFLNGFIEGYNTMDVLASLAFGIIVIRVVRNLGVSKPDAIAKSTLKAGIFCSIMMIIIYVLITLMGAQTRALFPVSENGGIALAQIAEHYFGKAGQVLLAIMVFLACLKTAIGLATSCSETFEELFPKVKYWMWVVIFTIVPLFISNVGLTMLIAYATPILMFLYPLAIVLILLCLFGEIFEYDRRIFISVTVFTAIAAFLDLLRTLPLELRDIIHVDGILQVASTILPLYKLGMGWVIPAIVGLAVGIIVRVCRKQY